VKDNILDILCVVLRANTTNVRTVFKIATFPTCSAFFAFGSLGADFFYKNKTPSVIFTP
jgi:hypothetical protein